LKRHFYFAVYDETGGHLVLFCDSENGSSVIGFCRISDSINEKERFSPPLPPDFPLAKIPQQIVAGIKAGFFICKKSFFWTI
jgi:hypothetical protein